MGSGKSSLGSELAETISKKFIDLDIYISEKEGMSIPDIFQTKGEIYFRKIEATYLLEILNSNTNFVLALGGGTPCYGMNMDNINKSPSTNSIYLKASIPTLANRLESETDTRPLLKSVKSKEELQQFIGKHLFERNSFYSRANMVVSTDNKTKKDILEELVFKLL